MKSFLFAGLLAMPLLLLGQQRAVADGGCGPLGCHPVASSLWGGFKCWWHSNVGSCSCGCNYGGSCGSSGSCWGCNGGCGAGGPWYLYWPYDGQGYMTSPVSYPSWTYDSNFQTPAPISAFGQPAQVAYPNYWYGH